MSRPPGIQQACAVSGEAHTAADTIDPGSPWRAVARSAAFNAPYLARLMAQRPDLIEGMDADWPQRRCDSAIRTARSLARDPPPLAEAMARLRRAKAELHLAAAIADLAQVWPLARVTGALTSFADASLAAAVALAARAAVERGEIETSDPDDPRGPLPGMAFIAMGKMGAGELNYSSDIDFSVFYEPAAMRLVAGAEARAVALRIVQVVVKALEEITADGYVFRTDLRLRPDPASTPPAVTIAAAEIYYQSLGQNWERAAFIKARACAGDAPLGRQFLKGLESYVWRRHLDYAAVADVHSIKRQILTAHRSAGLDEAVFDVKLGSGGIRDIELHAQTQQLILGGRNPSLRERATLAALAALGKAGVIDTDAREGLSEAYEFYRAVEHRIQMLEDAQTHRIPKDAETRARLAALCGFADLGAFEQALVARRARVAEIDRRLFGRFESLADPLGALSFTGVEDNPDTLATLERLGFSDPARVAETIRGWHHGRVRAMRAERAREILTALTPRLLRAISAAGDPDATFRRFAVFFAGLNAGVQVLALLQAQPKFLEELVSALALAPRLAHQLARCPALLDAMIDPRFERPLADEQPGERRALIDAAVGGAEGFEQALNAARRAKREEAFRIGMQVLSGRATAQAAGAAHADLAEAVVGALAAAALAEVERLHGAQPGAFSVLALGKFGGRELAEGSDLDIMLVYDAPEHSRSGGGRGVSAVDFYARLTQRLISALSAPTEEGILYEVDMQLRPSGSKGPVAVQLSSFARYYADEAWTWELLALTRLRLVAGDPELGARVTATARAALARGHDSARILAGVADMRARMDRERPARGQWDLKLAPGGFVDIEFIAQAGQLLAAHAHPDVLAPNTGEALGRLAQAGALDPAAAATLREAWSLLTLLHQALRICVEGEFDPQSASGGLKKLLARVAGVRDFSEVEARLAALQARVRELFLAFAAADGSAIVGR
jgi:glutamate-ammonia-ligase adenylyltransferase